MSFNFVTLRLGIASRHIPVCVCPLDLKRKQMQKLLSISGAVKTFLLIVLMCAFPLHDATANGLFGLYDSREIFRNIPFPIDAVSVHCAFQDSRGMTWFGTRNGLYSYNGYNLHSYHSEYGSESNVINCILPINGHTLFLGTDKGLMAFDMATKKFGETRMGVKGIRAMAKMGKNVFIGTHNSGLFCYNVEKGNTVPIKIANRTIPMINALEIVGSRLFIGSSEGLACYDGVARWVNGGVGKNVFVSSLCYNARRDILWIGTDGLGLCKYDFGTNSIQKTGAVGNAVIKCITSDTCGNIFMGTDAGLYILDDLTRSLKHIMHDTHNQSSLCNDVLWCAFQDVERNVWLGTNRGVSLLPNARTMYTIPLSEITSVGYGNMFTSIQKDDEGTYWLGGENGILRISSADSAASWFRSGNKGSSLRHNHVRKIYKDRDGVLWIASDGGVARYDKRRGCFEYFSISHSSQNYDTKWSYDLYEDDRGRLWIASYLGGLFIVDKRRLTRSGNHSVMADTVLLGCPVYQLGHLKEGKIVANTQKGIVCIDQNTLSVKEYGAYDDIMTVFNGEVWYSSEGRLYRIDGTGHKHEIAYDNGTARRIMSFVSDSKRLWFSTSDGIFYVDSKSGIAKNHISIEGGFLTGFYDKAQRAIVWGGNDCVALMPVNANSMRQPSREVFITSIMSNGMEIQKDADYTLKVLDNGTREIRFKRRDNIALELSSFYYADNGGHEFYYSIDSENKWNKTSKGQNILTLAELSGGTHTLRLSEINPLTGSNVHISSVALIVPYPWYACRAAIVIYILLAACMVCFTLVFVRRRNRRKFERLEREHYLEMSALKMDFFVNISHELKTPLSLILAPLDKLISEMKDSRVKTVLESIQKSALRLNSLIRKVLDFKQIEYESEDTLMRTRVDICQLIRNSIGNFALACEQRHITITFHPDSPQLMLNVDVLKMESVMLNLLSNAMKHVPDATGRIDISLSLQNKNVDIVISDNGSGIDERKLPYIFVRYFQGDSGDMGGNGIGLHLVKKFVELHGGSVSAENKGGLVVTLSLPMEGEVRHDNSHEHKETDSAICRKTILIIDDNKEIVDFLRSALSDNYDCMAAYDGFEGLKIAENSQPDLIIVDQMMPRMDGMEFVRKVRHNVPTAATPVIMLTAKDDYSTEMESIKAGVDVFMPKPFDMKRLSLQIVSLLKRRETIRKCQAVQEVSSPDFAVGENHVADPDEVLLKDLICDIERNMGMEGFSVENLAKDIGISQKQLYRKVKQLTGMTPVGYIRKMRMMKAHALLSQKGFTVKEVLYMVGMSNMTYFTKCFTEEYGISPKDYAKSQ